MSDSNDARKLTGPSTAWTRCAAWGAHLTTLLGIVCAVLAAEAIIEGPSAYGAAFAWLLLAVAIDAIDGPLARLARVREVLPHIDGARLDDLIDYVNYTFLPLVMIARAGWLPEPAFLWASIPAAASLFAFVHTGAKESQRGFFRGFPSYWNIFAFYTAVCFAPWGGPYLVLALVLLLSVLSIVPVRFIYPTRAKRLRWLFLAGGFGWAVSVLAMLPDYPQPAAGLVWLSFIFPAGYTALSIWLDFATLE